MSVDDAYAASLEISRSGAPDDRPYANPFYWAAFTFNGSSQ